MNFIYIEMEIQYVDVVDVRFKQEVNLRVKRYTRIYAKEAGRQ